MDDQAWSYRPPPPSSIGYLLEQAIRGGYPRADFGSPSEFFPHSSDVREAIQRELQKERISQEMIADEMARKRQLEAEVMREMMLEREMAFRWADEFSVLSGSSVTRFDQKSSFIEQSESRSLEERLSMPLEGRTGFQDFYRVRWSETVPFQRSSEPRISEIISREEVVFMGKTEANLSGVKRKAVTPPAVGAVEPREKWRCAICQVSAPTEQGLNQHLQGRRHKTREMGLKQRGGKNYSIGLFPKKTDKPIKPVDIANGPKPEEVEKLEGESLLLNKTELVLQKNVNTEAKKDGDLRLQTDENTRTNKNEDPSQEVHEVGDSKKFKVWCELCQVGTHSNKVMKKHKMGKKHRGKLHKLNQKLASISDACLGDAHQEEKEAQAVAKVAPNEEISVNANRKAAETHEAAVATIGPGAGES